MHGIPDKQDGRIASGILLWFRLFALVLAGLVLAKLPGMEVVVEVSYDGKPYHAALTDAGSYFGPLLLVLPYILWYWIRNLISRSR